MTAAPTAPTDPSNPLLTYSLLQEPDPIQVSAKASLTLLISSSAHQPITCTRIVVTLPVGEEAKDLTGNPDSIVTTTPPGWSASRDPGSGIIILSPGSGGGTIQDDGLTFVLAAIAVNDQPGTAKVTIEETASSPDQPTPATRTTTLPVPKFPTQLSLSDLRVVAPSDLVVPFGGTATLMWTGTGDATYTLVYQPADDGPPVVAPPPPIGNLGPYTSVPLTRSGNVIFTLTAQVAVPGEDEPLVTQRQVSVSIATLSLELLADPPAVGVNGLVRLRWKAPNADHCTLEDGKALPASGTHFLLLQETRTFTLTAFGSEGQLDERQLTVQVDPSIVATEAGHTITGDPGSPGAPGELITSGPGEPLTGDPGGRGSDGVLRTALPLLDTTNQPARVIPIAITGGRGGDGGVSGVGFSSAVIFAPGGPGGDGGDAILDVILESAGLPAQYIIQLVAGAAGGGGAGGCWKNPLTGECVEPGAPGAPGNVGSVSMTIKEST